MKKNLILAGLIAAGLVLWLLSGLSAQRPESLNDTRSAVLTEPAETRMRVRVARFDAEQRTLTRILRGKTASKRRARVSAEIGARVIARPAQRGEQVEAGAVLCELAVDDREAAVREAQANLSRAEIEFQGARALKGRELLAEIRIAQVAAQLESARTGLERARLNLQRTRIVAPFAGVVEALHMNVGDLARAGDPCATLIDLDPLLIAANVPERDIDAIELGRAATARTSTAQRLEGVITFVGSESDPSTRTYPIEITVPNPGYRIRSGLTTVASVAGDTVLAHRVSPALFTLNDQGIVGLRAVDSANRVVFYPVDIVEDGVDGAWVTGLPGVVRLITAGQEFVGAGEQVEVQESRSAPVAASAL